VTKNFLKPTIPEAELYGYFVGFIWSLDKNQNFVFTRTVKSSSDLFQGEVNRKTQDFALGNSFQLN